MNRGVLLASAITSLLPARFAHFIRHQSVLSAGKPFDPVLQEIDATCFTFPLQLQATIIRHDLLFEVCGRGIRLQADMDQRAAPAHSCDTLGAPRLGGTALSVW